MSGKLYTSAVLTAFAREAERSGRSLSEVSLKQHFDVWLRTYSPPRGSRLGEDGLDSPLASLGLIRPSGEIEEVGRREPAYSFDCFSRPSAPSTRHCSATV